MAQTSVKDSAAPAVMVSAHGGHSGQFCLHARDALEEIVNAYIDKGFVWAGITEHMPPADERFVYPDEKAAGFTAGQLKRRFFDFIRTGRALQHKYQSAITLYIGFETETYTGSNAHVRELMRAVQPDYVVGSVHHVDDLLFDYSGETYRAAAETLGGIDALYCRYFDQQYRMIEALKPPVVGHFDLIRLYDPDYAERFKQSNIRERVQRNLQLIKTAGLLLDVNARALLKGAAEPYPCRPILEAAIEMGIGLVPGDDSHGTDTVGAKLPEVIDLIRQLGASTEWRLPAMEPPAA